MERSVTAIASPATRVQDYVELTKPRITFMVVVTSAGGYLLGAPGGGSLLDLLHTIFGTALVGSAASALNQWLERDTDGQMDRTKNRPLPSGRLAPTSALVFGIVVGLLGTGYLMLFVNTLTAGLGLTSLLLYVLAYTPMKRVSSLCTIVGAVPGALPPVMGWAAARDDLSTGAWVLFSVLFLWQMPHFLAIAWMHREDYRKGGQKMLPLFDPDGMRTGRQMVLYCLALLPVSLLPSVIGLTGDTYFVGALVLGMAYLAASGYAAAKRTTGSARTLLRVSVVYLPILMGLMAASRVAS